MKKQQKQMKNSSKLWCQTPASMPAFCCCSVVDTFACPSPLLNELEFELEESFDIMGGHFSVFSATAHFDCSRETLHKIGNQGTGLRLLYI